MDLIISIAKIADDLNFKQFITSVISHKAGHHRLPKPNILPKIDQTLNKSLFCLNTNYKICMGQTVFIVHYQ